MAYGSIPEPPQALVIRPSSKLGVGRHNDVRKVFDARTQRIQRSSREVPRARGGRGAAEKRMLGDIVSFFFNFLIFLFFMRPFNKTEKRL